ncbi:MAG TPA: hypothetical protein VNY05_24255 [Candidatus Acidoferrales bacterium]|jgi:hypothetical protein|nr:hypothetical protein [Candidatus Acidoferrales bacterium]
MTINITPADEKIIQEKLRTGGFGSVDEVIHRALLSLATPETPPLPTRPRRNLVDVLSEPPFAGSELNLEAARPVRGLLVGTIPTSSLSFRGEERRISELRIGSKPPFPVLFT